MYSIRKISLLFIAIALLFGYGFFVAQAVYPLTQFSPGETLDPGFGNPGCTPGSANCSVSSGPSGFDTYVQFNDGGLFGASSDFTWDDTNKIFNIGDIGGVGNSTLFSLDDVTQYISTSTNGGQFVITATPFVVGPGNTTAFTVEPAIYQVQFGDVEGNANGTMLTLNDNSQSINMIGKTSVTGSLLAVDSTSENANDFITTLTSSGAVTNASYKGFSSTINYTSDNDISGTSSQAPIVGVYGSATNSGNGDILGNYNGVIGGLFQAYQSGTGTANNVNGISVIAGANSGDVLNLKGVNSNTVNFGTGTVTNGVGLSFGYTNYNSSATTTNAYGVTGSVNSGDTGITGTISNAYASNFRVIAKDGTIGSAVGIKLGEFMENAFSGTITSAIGIDMSASLQGETEIEPGIEATGNVTGISFTSYPNLPGPNVGSLVGTNVYGIYFNDQYSLQGSDDEYALYIGDTDAENWFSNGVIISASDIDMTRKLSASAVPMVGTNPLYIGTSQIDVTPPSDERTKQNISSTMYGLSDLNQINVVDFTYDQSIINDNNEQHSGVLAQQVLPIYPEVVSTRSDGYYMVDYKKFTPLIIKSIQELDMKIKDLQEIDNQTIISYVRDWLASATNGIQNIFSNRIETNELCVGSRCITEAEFIQLLDTNSISGSSSNITDDTDEILLEDDTQDGDIDDEGLIVDGENLVDEGLENNGGDTGTIIDEGDQDMGEVVVEEIPVVEESVEEISSGDEGDTGDVGGGETL